MSLFRELYKKIMSAREGKANVIPICYDRVKDYIEIAKHTMYLIGAETGAGKSTTVQEMFCIEPIEWYIKNKPEGMKLSVIGFFMEREQAVYTARWISRKIFQDTGISIEPKKILGRKDGERVSDFELEMIMKYEAVLDSWEKDDLLLIHEGSKNPTGISKWLEEFAKKHGTIVEKDKTNHSYENILATRTYTPNHPNHIVIVIGDNSGILAPEGDNKTKTLVDKFSRTMREARDIYGFSPVIVQQLSREMSNVNRQRFGGDLAPKLSDFADSSQTQRDADVVMALFNPFEHKVTENEHNGYNLKKLKDDKFRTYYRSLSILKNSFDAAPDVSFPMAIHPVYGMLKTLPRVPTDDIYSKIVSGSYFLEEQEEDHYRGNKVAFNGMGRNSIWYSKQSQS